MDRALINISQYGICPRFHGITDPSAWVACLLNAVSLWFFPLTERSRNQPPFASATPFDLAQDKLSKWLNLTVWDKPGAFENRVPNRDPPRNAALDGTSR